MPFYPNKMLLSFLKKTVEKPLDDSATILQKRVISEAPKDSGALKKSIKTEKKKDGEVRVGTDLDYAPIVEFGTRKKIANPFFRTAIAKSKDKMLKPFKDIL